MEIIQNIKNGYYYADNRATVPNNVNSSGLQYPIMSIVQLFRAIKQLLINKKIQSNKKRIKPNTKHIIQKMHNIK